MQDLTHSHPSRQHSHAVHFYSDGPEMEAHVAAFIQDGIQAGGTVLTIATKERRKEERVSVYSFLYSMEKLVSAVMVTPRANET